MKVLVLGAGIAGITAAYELNRDGHEVVVLDRETEAASLTSAGNAGLFAPGHAYAWSSPAAPGILLRSLWRNDQALRFKPTLDPAFWRWMAKFWGQCTAERAAANTRRKARLCNYSLSVFHDTLQRAPVAYDGRKGGLLYLYRSPAALAAAAAKSRILSDAGCVIETLAAADAARIDPALSPVRDKFAGALWARDDESGDCRLFARNMADWLLHQGVRFEMGREITSLLIEAASVKGVVTDDGPRLADAVILCLGVHAPRLAKPAGVVLPIYPVKGYSVTAPVAGRNSPPAIGGVDEESLVAYAPYGDRIRVTATAEFSGYSTTHKPSDFAHMLKIMAELFPDGADWSQARFWAGLRPMTPEGSPILGATPVKGLWLNTGLGHMGWTMSHATARIVADLVAGRTPAIPLDGLEVAA